MAICSECAVFSPLVYIENFDRETEKCQFCKKEIINGVRRIKVNKSGTITCEYGDEIEKNINKETL
jgi:hypothetical protein